MHWMPLYQVVNLLITGEVPAALAPYLAGGNLTALMKLKELGWDVRPIAVGEVLRRLAGKCACALTKEKATDFFAHFQFGVACPGGTEKIIHRLRQTQCAIHFPELLPWVSWCYSQHQYLWHPMDFEILGAPIGSHDFCTAFIERKQKEDNQLLSLLPKLCDPQSAIALLRCTVEIELTPRACNQAKLGLKYGGLGLRSLAMHAQAAYIASLSTSLTPIQPSELTMQRLCDAIMVFNGKVACCEHLSVEDVLATSQHQHKLSSAIEKAGFLSLLDGASTVDKARLLAISAPQAHAWLRAQPCPKLGLDLLPNEVQALVKWWLGLPVFTDADACPHCSQTLVM
eukprot:Em0113g2a